jgi:hypothetical protein
MTFQPTADTAWQRLLRAVLLLVVCGLCGTFDILNNNFARWVARASSLPEEEEVHAKDRTTLVAAAQPARRGGLRPRTAAECRAPGRSHDVRNPGPALTRASHVPPPLTGAGIFQHC